MEEEIGESGAGDVLCVLCCLPSRGVHSAAKLGLLSRKQGRLPLATVSKSLKTAGRGVFRGKNRSNVNGLGRVEPGRFTRPGRVPEDSG